MNSSLAGVYKHMYTHNNYVYYLPSEEVGNTNVIKIVAKIGFGVIITVNV